MFFYNYYKEERSVHLKTEFPPSVNTYWRKGPSGMYLSENAKQYKGHILDLVSRLKEPIYPNEPLFIYMGLHPPDKRKRDLDNYAGTAVLDALAGTNMFSDDAQFHKIHSEWKKDIDIKEGYAEIFIELLR